MPSLLGSNYCAFGVYQDLIGGEALASYQSLYLTSVTRRSEGMGAKVRAREEKNPDHLLRSRNDS